MQNHSAKLILSHYRILWRLTRNSLRTRYAGSILGMGWMVLYPTLFLAIYAVLYLFVFRIRPVNMDPVQYVLYIFAGLIPMLMLSETLNTGVMSVVDNKNVLNNTVFPVDLVPVKAVLEAQGVLLVGFSIIVIALVLLGRLTVLILLFPIIWGLQLLFLVGTVWILSLGGIILRDLRYLTMLATILLIIASPIAYTPDMVPDNLKLIIYLNPFAYYSIAFQKVLVLGIMPSLLEILVMFTLSLGVFFIGGKLFANVKQVLVDYV